MTKRVRPQKLTKHEQYKQLKDVPVENLSHKDLVFLLKCCSIHYNGSLELCQWRWRRHLAKQPVHMLVGREPTLRLIKRPLKFEWRTDYENMQGLLQIPRNVLEQLLEHVTSEDLLDFMQTCKQFYSITYNVLNKRAVARYGKRATPLALSCRHFYEYASLWDEPKLTVTSNKDIQRNAPRLQYCYYWKQKNIAIAFNLVDNDELKDLVSAANIDGIISLSLKYNNSLHDVRKMDQDTAIAAEKAYIQRQQRALIKLANFELAKLNRPKMITNAYKGFKRVSFDPNYPQEFRDAMNLYLKMGGKKTLQKVLALLNC